MVSPRYHSMTILTMIWQGPRGYTLAHAAAVAKAVARHITLPYRFVVLTDQPHPVAGIEVVPLPEIATTLAKAAARVPGEYPKNWAKLWLFSPEAQLLAPRVLYLDADSLVRGDLAPLWTYQPEAPFVGMQYGPGKLSTAMFRLDTGAVPEVWDNFVALLDGLSDITSLRQTDQEFLRTQHLSARYPCWPRDLGLFILKELESPGQYAATLPPGVRVIHPSGKTKPWHPRFLERYPWVREVYPWP